MLNYHQRLVGLHNSAAAVLETKSICKILKKLPKIITSKFQKSVLQFFCALAHRSCALSFVRTRENRRRSCDLNKKFDDIQTQC